jgi:pimeloyl-ACP methyl ester carboxylesterase
MPASRRTPPPEPLPGPGEPPLPPWPGHTVSVGGHALYVRRAGRAGASPAVFVHGLGGSSNNWTDLVALLADRVDAHAPDLPGFGRSGPPKDGRYGIDTHADAVVAYVRSIDAGPVHLLGNSLGGAVSVRVAAEHPELVRSLTLVSPALPQYRLRRTSDPRLALMLLPGLSALVDRERERATPERIARDVLGLCVVDTASIHPDRIRLLADEITRRRALPWASTALTASLRGLVRSYFELGPRNLWRQLGTITAPTLVVWGDHDRLVPHALGPAAVRRLRHGRLLAVPDAAHVAQIERPQVVADAVRALLDETEGLRASA